jgi:iron complex transport system ATP-binding protein
VCAAGAPTAVLTEETVRRVFGLESVITTDPVSGSPLMVPIGRHHADRRR